MSLATSVMAAPIISGTGSIVVSEVTKTYGPSGAQTFALDRISLDVAPGEFCCLVGASGCGKSTLLNLLAGLDQPAAGTVSVAGRSALMFQESALFPWLSVWGNVRLGLQLAGVPKGERRPRAKELLAMVHLKGMGGKRPHELSGGMRQRVALARALGQNASVLLMDEPFGAIDAITRDLLHDELERVWQETGVTIVFVTHNVAEAVRLGDRVLVLSSRPGRVVAEFPVTIPRPRRLDSPEVSLLSAAITDRLRQEVRRHGDAYPSPVETNGHGTVLTLEPPVDRLEAEMAGLDNLETPVKPVLGRLVRVWAAAWPKLAALALFFGFWQGVVWAKLKPSYALAGPGPVLGRLFTDIGNGDLLRASATTLQRAAIGYSLAVVIGVAVGLAVARSKVLRAAVGSMITGLQTMPTIAWFPLAILLFQLSETAITFVVVLGAAPAIANGVIAGVDHIPPVLLRAGRVLGARGLNAYRHVILPAAFPGLVAGLKQGWAFAWRSLMAGELIVIVANKPSLGVRLQFAREMSDVEGLMAAMLALLIIGIAVDSLVFGRLERVVRRRWGLDRS